MTRMTLEEYAATYPDVCSGCAMINFLYDTDDGLDCQYLDGGDLSMRCPCIKCLVKTTCLEPCSLY